ncbi:MAG: hypothetical protein K0B02_00465 [DPANN group archaeon]|nr:hypothetical protein [DPANN group archaeon]
MSQKKIKKNKKTTFMYLKIISLIIFIFLLILPNTYAQSPGPKILLVDDDHNLYDYDFKEYYITALSSYNYENFTVDSLNNGPTYNQMKDYDIVIWFTGKTSQLSEIITLTTKDETNLIEYLDNGGNLFISSSLLGFDLKDNLPDYTSIFYNNYLQTTYNSVNTYISLTNTNDSVSHNLELNLTQIPINNLQTKIEYNPIRYPNISTVYKSGNIKAAIKTNTETYKVVYFAFGFEAVTTFTGDSKTPSKLRSELMVNIINYLYTPETNSIVIDPPITSGNITITANCYDSEIYSNIKSAEYYIDDDKQSNGNNIQLFASDGTFNNYNESINATTNTSSLTGGEHTIYIHCQDKDGFWGKYDNKTFTVSTDQPITPQITVLDNANGYIKSEITQINISKINNTNTYTVSFSCDNLLFSDENNLYSSDNVKGGVLQPIEIDFHTFIIDTTDSSMGCNQTDGLKTIYLRAKSYAGIENTTHTSDTTILDRVTPEFVYVNVTDPDTYYMAGDNVTIQTNLSEPNLIVVADLSKINTNFSFTQQLNYIENGLYKYTTENLDANEMIEGLKIIKLTATDLAGNVKTNESLQITIDKTEPDTPTMTILNYLGYTLYEKPEITISTIYSENPADYMAFSCDNNYFTPWYPISTSFNQFNTTNTTYGCSETDGNKTIFIKVKDYAGNINAEQNSKSVILDREKPSIDSQLPTNNSNIQDIIEFNTNISEDNVINIFTYNTTESNHISPPAIYKNNTFASYLFTPSWLEEGINNIMLFMNDFAGNIKEYIYSYRIDNTNPITTNNYTFTDWRGTNQDINLTCNDIEGSGCNTTKYCIINNTDPPCTPNTIGMYITINCNQNEACNKKIYYYSTDLAKNYETFKSTNEIKIDKKPPVITINTPENGQTYAATINILTEINDYEIGDISYVSYNINNTIANGTLNESLSWDTTWNSSIYTNGTFNLTVFANDTLGNNITKSIIFYIDNNLPSANIYTPNKIYTNNNNITLNLMAQKENGNLSNCSYYIYNFTETTNSSEKINIEKTECNFTDNIFMSSWYDGNYTINFTAIDILSNIATDKSWFYLDRISPIVELDNSINNTWTKNTIPINYNATDLVNIFECKIRYKNNTNPWSVYKTIDCGNYKTHHFETSQCHDNAIANCQIELYVKDFSGNIENQSIYIKVDNSPPNITIISPPANTWNNSNFTVTHTETDPQGQICSYKIYGTTASNWMPLTCNQNILVDADTYCAGTTSLCTIYINSTNNAGTSLYVARTYQIERQPPEITEITLGKSIVKDNNILEINISGTDTHNNIDTIYADILNTTGHIVNTIQFTQIDTNKYGGTYTVSGNENGLFTINITTNDTLGNSIYNDSKTFLVKNIAPISSNYSFDITTDTIYNDTRIIYNNTILFLLNLTDAVGVNTATITLKTDQFETNHTLTPQNNNYINDIWTTQITTTQIQGKYTISKLYINDTLGNSKILNETEINKSFLVVVPKTNVQFNTNEKNATRSGTTNQLNLTINFNKTLSNSTITLYIPPNNASYNNTNPTYLNNSNFVCTTQFGTCNIYNISTNENQTYYLIFNFTGPIQEITILNTNIFSSNKLQDTNYTWYIKHNENEYNQITKITAPKINITNLTCNDLESCQINQNTNFSIQTYIKNEYISENYTGDAYNVSVTYIRDNTNITKNIGDINSTIQKNISFDDFIETPGNYIINIIAKDNITQEYIDQKSYTITIKDKNAPNWISTSINKNKDYINNTLTITTRFSDNIGVTNALITIKKPDGNETNYTMILSGSGSIQTGYVYNNATAQIGLYNITRIYANDAENNKMSKSDLNLTFEIKQLEIYLNLNETILNVTNSLNIEAIIKNNITNIETVYADILKPRGQKETIILSQTSSSENSTIYTTDYTNITQSGDYTINITVNANGYATNTSDFFVNYGFLNIIFADGVDDTLMVPVNRTYNHSIYIIPQNGDLIDINSILSITNQSVINITQNDILNKYIGNISYEDYKNGYLIQWDLNTTTIDFTNISINITSVYSNKTQIMLINITEEDYEKPTINSFNSINITNLYEILTITVNVTDNTIIKQVKSEITYPDNTTYNFTGNKISPNLYEISFSNTNQTGNYSYKIYAKDIADNENESTINKYFNVTNEYHIDIITDFDAYNKGEDVNITIITYNINNESISNFNTTLNLTKPGNINVSLIDNKLEKESVYSIKTTDAPLTLNPTFLAYTLDANVSKNGNIGYNTKTFNVTKNLVTEFISLSEGQYFATNSQIPVSMKITNINGNEIYDVIVSAKCTKCLYPNILLTKVTSTTYSNLEQIISPETYESFSILIRATDFYDNGYGDEDTVVLTTIPQTIIQNNNQGGSSSSTNNPGLLDTLFNMFFDNKTEENYADFTFNLKRDEISLIRGTDTTIITTLENTGTIDLEITSYIKKDCCEVTLEKTFNISKKNSIDIPIQIDTTLNTTPGNYLITIYMKSVELAKSKTIKLQINANPNIEKIYDIEYALQNIEKAIELYKRSGLNTKTVETKFEEIKKILDDGKNAIITDDNDKLQLSANNAQIEIMKLRIEIAKLETKWFLIKNKWNILALIFFITMLYLASTRFIIPYILITKDIHNLKSKELSLAREQKSTEIEYFKRVIDKITFTRIMTTKHGALTDVRTKIKYLNGCITKLQHFETLSTEELGEKYDYKKMIKEQKEKINNKIKELKQNIIENINEKRKQIIEKINILLKKKSFDDPNYNNNKQTKKTELKTDTQTTQAQKTENIKHNETGKNTSTNTLKTLQFDMSATNSKDENKNNETTKNENDLDSKMKNLDDIFKKFKKNQ